MPFAFELLFVASALAVIALSVGIALYRRRQRTTAVTVRRKAQRTGVSEPPKAAAPHDPLQELARLTGRIPPFNSSASPIALARRATDAAKHPDEDKLDMPAFLRVQRAPETRNTEKSGGKRETLLERQSAFGADTLITEGNIVNIGKYNTIIDFNSRKDMFKFVAAIASVDVRSSIKGMDGNGISVPASIMDGAEYKPFLEDMKDSYRVREPSGMPTQGARRSLAELAEICEAKIELLPF